MAVKELSDALLLRFRSRLLPLLSPEQIGFCIPGEGTENIMLGLFFYSLARDARYSMSGRTVIDSSVSQQAPLCMEATLMVTPYLGKKGTMVEEYHLLDCVLQMFHEDPMIETLGIGQPPGFPKARAELMQLSPGDAGKLWHFSRETYRTSLFYRIAPIAVVSGIQVVTPRVKDTEMTAEEGQRGKM